MLDFGGACATEHQIEFFPSPEAPGYATLLGKAAEEGNALVPINKAELIKINHDRGASGWEALYGEMLPTKYIDRNPCRRCGCVSRFRCPACWTFYCSAYCKRRNWAVHVFRCRTPDRPNDVDFLRLVIRRVGRELKSENEERRHNAIIYLLADDHICKTFGFNNCQSKQEITNLVCIYDTMLSRVRQAVKSLQRCLETGKLGEFMVQFCQSELFSTVVINRKECPCLTWLLERQRTKPLLISNTNMTTYEIFLVAVARTLESFDLAKRYKDNFKLNVWQQDVFNLYVVIQPNIWLLPDIFSSSWIKFGFCYCKSFQQQTQLALKYRALVSYGANFDDIVDAYKTSRLADLMRMYGIDMSELGSQGVRLHEPPPCEYSIFRLMIGVEHALSGRFCGCFSVNQDRHCHSYSETHFDRESDTNFGFHLTNSWEKWQLLNFYKHLFSLSGFDPRCMAEAADHSDRKRLEAYINTLIPDMRRKLYDKIRANLWYPRLEDRLREKTQDGRPTTHFHLPCDCKVHDVVGPPGISLWSIDAIISSL